PAGPYPRFHLTRVLSPAVPASCPRPCSSAVRTLLPGPLHPRNSHRDGQTCTCADAVHRRLRRTGTGAGRRRETAITEGGRGLRGNWRSQLGFILASAG